MELPRFTTLRVRQTRDKPTRERLDALDHFLVVLPKRPGRDLLRGFPSGEHLRRVYERSHEGGECLATTRLPNDKATAVTLATFAADDAHGALSWARKAAAESLGGKPRRIGAVALGLAEPARARALEAFTAAVEAAAFQLPRFKSRDKHPPAPALTLYQSHPALDLEGTRAAALGNNIARWFTALPPSHLTARAYRDAIKQLADEHGLAFEFLGETRLERLGAGAFLAVSQGNADRDAGIVHLKYRPARRAQPSLALVGKGILFDTGGTNLKPFRHMLDMHTDMAGSAVALGTLVALAALGVPYAVDAWLAVTPNRISATAYTSQDVVTAVDGTTIQVVHTDAEGRMVLADTLALAARDGPDLIVDYATLTGTCVSALTERYSGVFSNREAANAMLVEAGRASGERVWPFPMDADFDDSLKSDVADVKQCSPESHGDHILAARFLRRFVPDAVPWIHVDLSAGTRKGGLGHVPTQITGFGVRLTLELLRRGGETPAALARQLSG